MAEKENKQIKEIVALDHEEALRFVKWAMTTMNTGNDISESKWLLQKKPHKKQKSPPSPNQTFWMEELKEGQHISPVYGLKEKEE